MRQEPPAEARPLGVPTHLGYGQPVAGPEPHDGVGEVGLPAEHTRVDCNVTGNHSSTGAADPLAQPSSAA